MFLKQIELENFKSFGGKVVVPLQDGYMAVTGPNGSGKSNIGDAIMFVLGPRSPKAVRAARIPDLVFSGAGKGKADHMMATLVFENSDRILPWDSDEVRLTRLIKLKGENKDDYTSYFYINDVPSKLADFEALLSKARISADGYNIVQQGDVTHIIQMGAVERRRILDGISGISSYDADLARAVGERTETSASMERIRTIRNEKGSTLNDLEVQRADAIHYNEVDANLRRCKAQLAVRQRDQERATLESYRHEIDVVQAEIDKLTEECSRITESQKVNSDAIEAKEKEIAERTGPEYSRIKSDVEQAKVELGTQVNLRDIKIEQAAEKERYALDLDEKAEGCQDSLADAQADLDKARADLGRVKAEKGEVDAVLRKITEEMKSHGGELTQVQTHIQELEKQIDVKNAEYQSLETAAASAKAVLDSVIGLKQQAEDSLQAAEFDSKNADAEKTEAIRTHGSNSIEVIGKEIADLALKEKAASKEEAELQSIYQNKLQKFNKLSAEKAANETANGGGEGYNRILALKASGQIKGIHGAVCNLATVSPGYEIAAGVAAGAKGRAIVVDNDAVAAECISYLKANKLSRVTFLPLNKMQPGRPSARSIMVVKQSLGYMTNFVKFDPLYANVFWYVFADTLVCSDLDKARAIMDGVRIVTKDGELLERSGSTTGGTINLKTLVHFGAQGSSAGELEKLAEEVEKVRSQYAEASENVRNLRDAMREAEGRMRSASKESAESQRIVANAEAKAESAAKELVKARGDLSRATSDLQTASEKNSAAQAVAAKAASSLQVLRDELAASRARLQEISPADLRERMDGAHVRSTELSVEEGDLSSQIKSLEVGLEGYRTQKDDYEKQAVKARDDAAKLRSEAGDMDEKIQQLNVDLDAKEGIREKLEAGQETLRTERDALLQTKYSLQNDIESNRKNIEVQSGLLLSKNSLISQSEAKLDALEAEVSKIDGEIPANPPSEETIKRSIRGFEAELESLGTVNQLAIAQYDEVLAAVKEMDEQIDLLTERIKALTELEADISAKKKGIFMQAYNAIDVNFQALFKELSGGGEATMSLEDPDDPFNGGLYINAKPRNGTMLRLEALSGGEKSLTALSFIFAIQEYQPSPFYVLDEVDMFLDAVNTELVASHIKTQSGHTQFIQVSLRKVALTKADNLIGVTRPPSGISKVIMQVDMSSLDEFEKEAQKRKKEAESNNTTS